MSHMSMDEMIEVLARYRYNAKHDADRIKALEDELSRLRASSFVTAVPAEQYERVIKAGDASIVIGSKMREIIGDTHWSLEFDRVRSDWHHVKKGGQS